MGSQYLTTVGANEYLVLWAYKGLDHFNVVTVEAPVEIKGRWEDLVPTAGGPLSNIGDIRATVYTGTAVTRRSLLWRGRLKDLPTTVTNIHQVLEVKTSPDIKNRRARYSLMVSGTTELQPNTGTGT